MADFELQKLVVILCSKNLSPSLKLNMNLFVL